MVVESDWPEYEATWRKIEKRVRQNNYMEKPLRFNPNSDEHLEWVLKLAYKYAVGDSSAATEETATALCDALCNLIGDEAFQDFCENDVCHF